MLQDDVGETASAGLPAVATPQAVRAAATTRRRLLSLDAADRTALGVWAAAYLSLLTLAWAAAWAFRATPQHAPLTGAFERWDAVLLRNIAKVTRSTEMGEYDRYNMQRLISVTANISGSDLSTVAKQVAQALRELAIRRPRSP